MVEANVLRDLTPPTSPDAPAFDPEEDFYFDPQWPHLQHVYSLFSNVLESQFMKAPFVQQYVTRAFIRKVPYCSPPVCSCCTQAHSGPTIQKLQLFRSYDKRERDALKNVLHRVYARMLGYRSYIRSLLSQMYLRYVRLVARSSVHGPDSDTLEGTSTIGLMGLFRESERCWRSLAASYQALHCRSKPSTCTF